MNTKKFYITCRWEGFGIAVALLVGCAVFGLAVPDRRIVARAETNNFISSGTSPAWIPQTPNIVITGKSGNALVSISAATGEITYGEGYEPDEAARRFWSAIGHLVPCPVRE